MPDTSADAAAYQMEIYRRMTPEERFELAWRLSLTAREFALARIRRDHPDFAEAEIMRTYIRDLVRSETPKTA